MTAAEFGRLLKEYPSMLENNRVLKAILMDTFPSERRNVNLLCTTHRAGVVSMLQSSAANGFLTARIVSVLTEDYDIAEDRAKWAADLWIGAFQLSTSIDEPTEPDSAADHAGTVQPHTAVANEADPSLFETERNATGCTIKKYLGSKISELIIPSQINGMPVTQIGYCAFADCTNLTRAVIPDGVTQIVGCAFNRCIRLASVEIPASVAKIGKSAFNGCTNLSYVGIPNSVTQIDESVFRNCVNLTSVEIPDSVTQIGYCAFDGCVNLTSVAIPDSVIQIMDWAFAECTSLKSVVLPASVTQIGDAAFEQCDSLTIHAPSGSEAERYAKSFGFRFKPILRQSEL